MIGRCLIKETNKRKCLVVKATHSIFCCFEMSRKLCWHFRLEKFLARFPSWLVIVVKSDNYSNVAHFIRSCMAIKLWCQIAFKEGYGMVFFVVGTQKIWILIKLQKQTNIKTENNLEIDIFAEYSRRFRDHWVEPEGTSHRNCKNKYIYTSTANLMCW